MKRGFAVLVFLAAMPAVAGAEEARARFAVSAYVPARASLEAVSEPAMLLVSEDDIARGYLDFAAVYRVRSNDPAGYMVRLSPRVGLTRSIEVDGFASRVVMREETVEVLQPAALRAKEVPVHFRMLLDAAAAPGAYAMPVHVSVASL